MSSPQLHNGPQYVIVVVENNDANDTAPPVSSRLLSEQRTMFTYYECGDILRIVYSSVMNRKTEF